jgi:hypothetical protein
VSIAASREPCLSKPGPSIANPSNIVKLPGARDTTRLEPLIEVEVVGGGGRGRGGVMMR